MKIKFYHLFLLCLFSSLNLNAQDTEFNLTDYRLPDYDFQSLDAEFSLGSGNNYNASSSTFRPTESISNSFSSNARLRYFRIKNDRIWQKSSFMTSFYNLSFNDRANESNSYESLFRFFTGYYVDQTNRKYIRPSRFREINFNFQTSFFFEKVKEINAISSTVTKPHEFKNLLILPLKFGKGRIEQVTDARQAIFILDRLKKQGRLNRTATKEEVRQFAEHISKVKNRRYFDFRLRRIYELEKVDSFLQAKDFISNTDMRYFAHLNDMWVYGDDQIRFSGNRVALTFTPSVSHVNIRNGGSITTSLNESMLSLDAGIEYRSDVPINMDWQNAMEVYSKIGFVVGRQDKIDLDDVESFLVPMIAIGANESLTYYPDTRTSIQYNLGFLTYLLGNNVGTEINFNGLNSLTIIPESSFSFNYFFTPRFQLNILGGINFSWKKEFESTENGSLSSSINPRLNELLQNLAPSNIRLSNYDFDRKRKSYQYRFSISLSYALF